MDYTFITTLLFSLALSSVFANKPLLRPSQDDVEKFQNESYVVSCTADPGVELHWEGPQGRSIPTNGRIHSEQRQGMGLMLMLDHIQLADYGKYTCISSKKESTSFTLSVAKITIFKNTPTVHFVNEKQNTTIPCEVEGEPKPTISWHRNNQTLNDPRYILDNKGLKIINANKNDSGVFTCRAIQVGKEDGFMKTVDITLKVRHKPEWKEPVEAITPVYGYIGGETNLTCETLAQPEAEYTWFRNNKNVRDVRLNTNIIHEPGRSVLQVLSVTETVFGQFQCQARNEMGAISRVFDLKLGEKPDPPTVLRVNKVTVHTAALDVAGDGGDLGVVGYRVQFVITRPGQEVSWIRPDYQDLYKNGDGQYVIRHLLEDTPYTVRAATRGPAGLSDYSTVTETLRTLKTGQVGSALRVTCSSLWLLVTIATLQAVY